MSHSDLARTEALTRRLYKILAGNSPETQGAALADCVAMWIAGHQTGGDDPKALEQLRERLLAMHCEMVSALVPVNAEIIGKPPP